MFSLFLINDEYIYIYVKRREIKKKIKCKRCCVICLSFSLFHWRGINK